jgi:hypothetical protein
VPKSQATREAAAQAAASVARGAGAPQPGKEALQNLPPMPRVQPVKPQLAAAGPEVRKLLMSVS